MIDIDYERLRCMGLTPAMAQHLALQPARRAMAAT
jgi:hypothetical protein